MKLHKIINIIIKIYYYKYIIYINTVGCVINNINNNNDDIMNDEMMMTIVEEKYQ